MELEEILRYTFEFLNGDTQGPNRRSLANLAMTCRTFSDLLSPALKTCGLLAVASSFRVSVYQRMHWRRETTGRRDV